MRHTVGLITLPDGRRLAVAVFVTDARSDEAIREGVIAHIGRAVYDEAVHTFGPTQPPVHSNLPTTPK